MKKSLLLPLAGVTLLALTATVIAQTATANTVIAKMKAAAHAFTLASSLNPGQTGLTSEPVEGKKTGDTLTAGEWNRVLELIKESENGPAVAAPSWVNVPLNDSTAFDRDCSYRFTSDQPSPYKGTNPYTYATAVSAESLVYILHNSLVSHINSSSKTTYRLNGADAGWNITKIEKLCGATVGTTSPTCPSGFVAVGSFCIEPTMSPKGKTWYEAGVACADKGAQLCQWSEWAIACKKGKLTDVQFGTTNGVYEWIDDYTGNAYQAIADPRVYSNCEYLSRADPKGGTTPVSDIAYRCCSSQK